MYKQKKRDFSNHLEALYKAASKRVGQNRVRQEAGPVVDKVQHHI